MVRDVGSWPTIYIEGFNVYGGSEATLKRPVIVPIIMVRDVGSW